MRELKKIATFGLSLNLYFIQDGEYLYPEIHVEGPAGTGGKFDGQCMSKEDIKDLGLALVEFAASLPDDKYQSFQKTNR